MVRVRLGDSYRTQDETGSQVDSSLVTPGSDGFAFVSITNNKGYSLKLDADTEVGCVSNAFQVCTPKSTEVDSGRWDLTAVKVVSTYLQRELSGVRREVGGDVT